MKTLKVFSCTLGAVATLVLCASSVKAVTSVTTNYSKLNISGTISTNLPEVSNGNTYKDPVKTGKYGNKQLLEAFAGWADTTWPAGAQLVIGWDHSGDVLVVDKTGTNVLFDATEGVSGAYFEVDFFDEYGVGADYGVDADPGKYGVVDTGTAYYYFYDDNVSLAYTILWGYGGNKQNFLQTWDAEDVGKAWSDSESAKFLFSGDQYFQDSGSDTTSTANITAHGKGMGYNYIGWAD